MPMVLEKSVLEQRLAQCRAAQRQKKAEHARLVALTDECVAQINSLIGREAELAELLALPEEPLPQEPPA